MNESANQKRKQLIAGVLGSLAAVLVGYQLYNILGIGDKPSAPPPPPVIVDASAPRAAGTSGPGLRTVSGSTGSGPAAQRVGTSGAALDPTLHMEGMLLTEGLVYSGSGRNIFSGAEEAPAPPPIPRPVAPPRQMVQSAPPPPPQPTGPPLLQVNLKFFGTATGKDGSRQAFLLNGDDVYVARAGDVVQRRYKIVEIAANSVKVEDLPSGGTVTLPLIVN